MNLEECLRGELGRLRELVDAAAPEIVAPRSRLARLFSFLSGILV